MPPLESINELEILFCAFSAAFMMSGCVFGLSSEAQNPATVTVTLAPPTTTAVYETVTKPPEVTPAADSGTVEPTRIPSTVAAPENRITWISQTKGSFDGGVAVSANGRYVTFISDTMNPVPENQCVGFTGDSRPCTQVYVFDRVSNAFQLASAAADGTSGSGHSGTWPEAGHHTTISGDGRFIAFASGATNLTPTLSKCTLFVHDRVNQKTECVGRTTNVGATSWYPTLSADGRFVAFVSEAGNLVPDDTNRMRDVFVHDRQTGRTARVSIATHGSQAERGDSSGVVMSANGRWIAFSSSAANLVPDDTNGFYDVFVHDRQTGQSVRVSLTDGGQEANGDSYAQALSADGCTIAFISLDTNLVSTDTNERWDVFVRDLCR